MRFNSAVLARRRQEIGRISNGERQQAQRERSIRQLVASAFAKKGTLCLTRKAYHSYMQKSYEMQSMAAMGFTKAKPRASSGGRWSEAEIAAMLDCLSDLQKRDASIHTQDPCCFLSHHGLLKQKSTSQVRDLLRYLEKKYEF